MESNHNIKPVNGFNEEEWMKILFLLADTEQWVKQLWGNILHAVPAPKAAKLLRRHYYLSPSAMAHILERHYYKIPRHPGTGKFTIPITEILQCIQLARQIIPQPVPGHHCQQRIWEAPFTVGINRLGTPTSILTVVTDDGDLIITAFPGRLEQTAILS
ncbi:MAG: hypothetical protein HEQ40_15940 [Lacibacter sp.]